jgi:hypothetical protein
MAKYYIIDSTKRENKQNPVMVFKTTDGVVKYLEEMCLRKFKKTRKQYMENVEGLGFGSDDASGRNFYEQMAQYFNIGSIRTDSVPIQCNIFDADKFHKTKDVHGD